MLSAGTVRPGIELTARSSQGRGMGTEQVTVKADGLHLDLLSSRIQATTESNPNDHIFKVLTTRFVTSVQQIHIPNIFSDTEKPSKARQCFLKHFLH